MVGYVVTCTQIRENHSIPRNKDWEVCNVIVILIICMN